MSRGRLITLEGGEGAGKSTAVETVRRFLERAGRQVVTTREPGGTPAAEAIRKVLLTPETGRLDPLTELMLMFAARRENVVRIIEPALAGGADVICDRFTDASYAYQGGGRGLGPEPVTRLAELVHPGLEPDLVLLLDVPVSAGLARIARRDVGPDRFERDQREFLERVRNAYLERARAAPERIAIVDSTQPRKAVISEIEKVLAERLR